MVLKTVARKGGHADKIGRIIFPHLHQALTPTGLTGYRHLKCFASIAEWIKIQ
jgi:hypothetical protein